MEEPAVPLTLLLNVSDSLSKTVYVYGREPESEGGTAQEGEEDIYTVYIQYIMPLMRECFFCA